MGCEVVSKTPFAGAREREDKMHIVSAYNEINKAKFEVILDTWRECNDWIREIKRGYPTIKSFKIFDDYESHKKDKWRVFIKV